MNRTDPIERRMPYRDRDLGALRERILRQTVLAERSAPLFPVRRLCIAGAAALLLAGIVAGVCLERRTGARADLDALLRTASDETVRQAAALNYDDILYEQQL